MRQEAPNMKRALEGSLMMKNYKVVSWRDYHGVETFFIVVNQHGDRCDVFASEWQALARAKELNEPPPPEPETEEDERDEAIEIR
jgi:hypothetical protein